MVDQAAEPPVDAVSAVGRCRCLWSTPGFDDVHRIQADRPDRQRRHRLRERVRRGACDARRVSDAKNPPGKGRAVVTIGSG